jgi:predicted MFS family arabinose efflux permease
LEPPGSSRAPARPGLRASPIVVVSIAAASFSTILSQSAFAPFLPLIGESLDTSVALLGQAPAASMLLAGALGLVVGPRADRYGQRRALLIGLVALAASAVGVALAQSYLMFAVVMLVSALGRATVLPVAMVVGGTRFVGDAQRRALSWMSTGLVAATILGVPFLTTVGEYAGWRGAFLTLAVIAAGAAVLVWIGLGPDTDASAAPFRLRDLIVPYRPIMRHRPTILFLAASLVSNIGQWNVSTYQGAFWIGEHHLTLQQVGWAALVQGIGGLAGSWLMSTPLGRVSPRRLLVYNRLGSGLLMAAPFLLPLPTLAAVICFALAYVLGGMGTIASTLALADAPTARATVLTLNGAAWSVGIALGAASGGLALVLGGYIALGVCALTTLVVASWLLLLSDRPT